MPEEPATTLTLNQISDIERNRGWDDPVFCEGPWRLIEYLVSNVSVDASQIKDISESLVFSNSQPGFSDRKKIWVKNTAPYGLGFFANGKWRMIWEYTPYAILYWPDGVSVPTYLTKLSDSEVTGAGLDASKNFYRFNPPF